MKKKLFRIFPFVLLAIAIALPGISIADPAQRDLGKIGYREFAEKVRSHDDSFDGDRSRGVVYKGTFLVKHKDIVAKTRELTAKEFNKKFGNLPVTCKNEKKKVCAAALVEHYLEGVVTEQMDEWQVSLSFPEDARLMITETEKFRLTVTGDESSAPVLGVIPKVIFAKTPRFEYDLEISNMDLEAKNLTISMVRKGINRWELTTKGVVIEQDSIQCNDRSLELNFDDLLLEDLARFDNQDSEVLYSARVYRKRNLLGIKGLRTRITEKPVSKKHNVRGQAGRFLEEGIHMHFNKVCGAKGNIEKDLRKRDRLSDEYYIRITPSNRKSSYYKKHGLHYAKRWFVRPFKKVYFRYTITDGGAVIEILRDSEDRNQGKTPKSDEAALQNDLDNLERISNDPVIEERVVEEPIEQIEEPVMEEPVENVEEPVVDEPAAEEPMDVQESSGLEEDMAEFLQELNTAS